MCAGKGAAPAVPVFFEISGAPCPDPAGGREGGALPAPRFGLIATFRAAVAEEALPPEYRGLVAHIQGCMQLYNTPDLDEASVCLSSK